MGTQNVLGTNYAYPDSGDDPWGDEHIVWASAVSSATNTLNALTTVNVGSGQGLAKTKTANTLPIKSLVAGSNITLSGGTDTVTINATGTLSGAPAGADTQIQYNNAGALGASSKFTFQNSNSTLRIGAENTLTTIQAPDATTSNTAGGQMIIKSGLPSGVANGSLLNIAASSAATSGNGGSLTISAGAGAGASGNGGNVIIKAGPKSGSGTDGQIKFEAPSFFTSAFDLSLLTDNRTFTFPNQSGTLAITGSSSPVTGVRFIGSSGNPTIVAGPGAGTSPTVSITGNDAAGLISITTGTGTSGSFQNIATITFNTTYTSPPRVIISPANFNVMERMGIAGPYVPATGANATTTTTFSLESGFTPLIASTLYLWYYHVIQ